MEGSGGEAWCRRVRAAAVHRSRGAADSHSSVRRGGRRERACDALSLIWPALGRSWPPAAAGGG